MNDEKLQNIEETLAFQDQEISTLNEIVTEQAKVIEALKQKIMALEGKIEDLEDSSDSDEKSLSVTEQAARNKPPHY